MALLLFGCCATGLFGCGSSKSADAGYTGPYGGQTGSLTPPCGVAPLTDDGSAVASGTNVAVVYTQGCAANNSLTVSGPNGTPVSYTLVPLDQTGAYIVRTNLALDPGTYSISLPAASAGATQVTVSDAAPLPTTLGTITADGVGTCDEVLFTLTLDPAAVPYATLIGLDAQVDDGQTFTWVPYGALALNGAQSALEFHCIRDCNLHGAHTITVTPKLAGQSATLPALSVPFTASCASADSPRSCATSLHQRASWPALIAALFAAAGLRRRRDSG